MQEWIWESEVQERRRIYDKSTVSSLGGYVNGEIADEVGYSIRESNYEDNIKDSIVWKCLWNI